MRRPKVWMVFALLLCIGALAACEELGIGGDAPAKGCAEPAVGMQTISVPKHGFCFAYPAEYQVEQPHEAQLSLYQGSLLDVEHARLQVEVEEANGRSAPKAADALLKDFEGMDVKIARSEIKLGGATAAQLDGVPGQDLGRVVLAVRGKRLYKLTFVPADPAEAARYAEMQALYQAVTTSWGLVD